MAIWTYAALTLAALGLWVSPAAAQTVDAAKPATLVAALQDAGYKAVLGKDNNGDPKITSAANGATFSVYFYGCEEHAACKSVQLAAGYTMKTKPAITKINEWNLNNRFAAAYLDKENDPNIQFDVVLVGGMPQSLFEETVSRWTDAMASFQQFVGW